MATISPIKTGDWASVRQAIAILSSQKFGVGSSPTFSGITLTGVNASRLLSTDSNNTATSADLIDWINGTTNEIIATDNGDGTITLSLDSSVGNSITYSDDDVSNPPKDYELDSAFGHPEDLGTGFLGILNDNGEGINVYLCFSTGIENEWFYLSGTKAEVIIQIGNPIGLLLSLTYSENEPTPPTPSIGNPFGAWLFWYTYAS